MEIITLVEEYTLYHICSVPLSKAIVVEFPLLHGSGGTILLLFAS